MCANAMIDSTNAVLRQTPENFDCIGVGVARDEDLSRVMNTLMLVAHRFQRIVRDIFIGKYRTARHSSLDNVRHQRCGLGIWYDLSNDPSVPFDHTKNRSLPGPARALVLA